MDEQELLMNEIHTLEAEYEDWNYNMRKAFEQVSIIEESSFSNSADINNMRELVGTSSMEIQALLDEKEQLFNSIRQNNCKYYEYLEENYRENNRNYEEKIGSLYDELRTY